MAARASEGGPPLLEGITRTFVFFFLEESELEGDLTWWGCSKPLPRDLWNSKAFREWGRTLFILHLFLTFAFLMTNSESDGFKEIFGGNTIKKIFYQNMEYGCVAFSDYMNIKVLVYWSELDFLKFLV